MSLINEALKRAQQLQENSGTAGGPPMRAVEGSHYPDAGAGLWLPALIGVVFSISVILLWQWSHQGGVTHVRARTPVLETIAPALAAPSIPAAATVLEKVAPSSVPDPQVSTVPENSSNGPVAGVSSGETNQAAPTVAEPAKPQPVTYKLQSLVYSAKNASAVINGKVVSKGDRVAGARVLAIGPDAVSILTPSGQTNLLELP